MFKPIIGYEGLYEISLSGQVKSLEKVVHRNKKGSFIQKEKMLKASAIAFWYPSVILAKNKIRTTKLIHRLIAEAFIPNPLNKPEVNHIDGNKENHNISNLEWVTRSENHIHAYKIGLNKSNFKPRFGKDNHNTRLNSTIIKEIKALLNKGIFQREIGKKYNLSQKTISLISKNYNKMEN